MNTKLVSRTSYQMQLLRFIFLVWFFISNVIALIAGSQDTTAPYFQVSCQIAKATIYLVDKSKISLESIIVSDSSLRGFKDDAVYRRIGISEIHSIKIKRNSVVKGLAYGAVIGGIVGYVVGNATYNGNSSYDEDSSKQELKSWAGAAIGVAPGAFIGGIVGGIFTKRHFRIDGDIEKLNKMVKRLQRAK